EGWPRRPRRQPGNVSRGDPRRDGRRAAAGGRSLRGRRHRRRQDHRPPPEGQGGLEMAKIWVYAELADGKPAAITLELLAKARGLGDVEAIALGKGAAAAAAILGKHGAKKVHVCEDEVFDQFLAQPATDTLEALVKAGSP